MELTPRTAPPPDDAASPRPKAHRRNPFVYGALVAVLVGLGVVVYQGLTEASLYFYNADEAVAQRADLGDKRFRLQGTVVDGSVATTDDGVGFTVVYAGASVDVQHEGDPPELFQTGMQVVVEGRWAPAGDVFLSDAIRVKHSEQYQAENQDRLDEAERRGSAAGDATATSAAP